MIRVPVLFAALVLATSCGAPSAHPTPTPPPAPRAEAPAPTPTPVEVAQPAPPAPRSLFDRLGGLPAITAVVESFVGRTTTDPRIRDRFFNTDAVHLKAMLVEQVCAATGGPCGYSGRDMKTTHAGMTLVDDEFTALVEDLIGALDEFHVPAAEKAELIGALGGMKPAIVAPTDQLHPLDAAKLAQAAALGAKLKDPEGARLIAAAVLAGQRGQRSYAEQLFSRAELQVTPRAVASIAATFRSSAPPRITTPLKQMAKNAAPQPARAVGSSDDDSRGDKGAASLEGAVLVEGAALKGVGVVTLEPIGSKWTPRTPKERVVEQRGREFAPHLVATPVGSRVSFPNFDSIYHNVFSLSAPAAFDLGLYRNGESREITFRKEGIVRIGCNLHSSMAAFIIVVSAPHYAVTDDAGGFKFHHLKPGKYRMKAWSEHSAEPRTLEVEVKPGANQVSIALDGNGSSANPDKFGELR